MAEITEIVEAKQETPEALPTGFLRNSLNRNKKQIIQARAEDIYEGLEMQYKRDIEDDVATLKRLQRNIHNRFDFSPDSSFSLRMVTEENFDPREIVAKDTADILERRNLQIKIEEMNKQYAFLFGSPLNITY